MRAVLALVRDTLREMYARKIFLALIGVEVFALVITALVLNSMRHTYDSFKEDVLNVADSAAAAEVTPRRKADDSVLGTLPAAEFSADSLGGAGDSAISPPGANATASPSRAFSAPKSTSAALANSAPSANALEEGLVRGPMGVYATFITIAVILVGIFATAGIVPAMMEKGTIDLLASKPLPRAALLLGRAGGGFMAVAINNFLFIACVWALFGLFTGVWYTPFLIWTFVLPQFSLLILYSGVLLLNVITESSVLPMILAYLHATVLSVVLTNRETTLYTFIENTIVRGLIDGLYYILPQTHGLVQATPQAVFTGGIADTDPFIHGAAFIIVATSLAVWRFSKKDF